MSGTLFAWCVSAWIDGGGNKAMKISFLLMIISVFVGLSYIPIRTEPKPSTAKNAAAPDSVPA
jgi:hypothetical protein